jgi:hypothetical protein
MSIKGWMGEDHCIYTYDLKRRKSCHKQWHVWTWKHCAEWNKLNTERQIHCLMSLIVGI